MDDFVLNVRQIGQYPKTTNAGVNDALLIQKNGAGGAYNYITPLDLFASSLMQEGVLGLADNAIIRWAGATISFNGTFNFSNAVSAPSISTPSLSAQAISLAGQEVATVEFVTNAFNALAGEVVFSFNGRFGNVQLLDTDILRAGGVLAINPHFAGVVTAPTLWNSQDCSDAVATTAFVQNAICTQLESGHVVLSYNGRGGHVVPIADDITTALTVFGEWGLANTPPSGDVSKRIANTAFVDDALAVFGDAIRHEFADIADSLDQKYAPLDSPQFVGIPTAPTAAQTVNSGQLATTAFVHAAVTASTTGVSSFNGRTGTVTLQTGDITTVGGALLAGPAFTGIPTAPLRALHDNSAALATTAFVAAEIAALATGVTSFNTRTGAVTLTSADVLAVGAAPLASPVFTGNPQAPTPTPGDNDTSIATTAFVTQAISVLPAPVTSFNGRTGAVNFQASDVSAVGGALLASPGFTGTPTGPTATPGTSNTQLATTAFVQAALTGVVSGVSSFNARTGAVTLQTADVTAVGAALLAGPTFTGVPSAPTASIGTNTTQIATTAFVQAALAAAPGGVSSFNGRTGAITFLAADVSAVGGALLASPAFSGNPTAPTPTPGDNDTSIATTAFVATAIASAGGVLSFNGRAGAVTMTAADVFAANGAVFRQADTAPAFANNTLWFDSVGGQLYVHYKDPSTAADNWVIANSMVASTPPPQPGQRVKLAENTISGLVANVVFTNLSTTYDEYELVCIGFRFNSDDNLSIQVSSDNGATWDSTSSYQYGWSFMATSSTYSAFSGSGVSAIGVGILGGQCLSSAKGDMHIRFFRPWESGQRRWFHFHGAATHPSSGDFSMVGSMSYLNNPAINALRVRGYAANNFNAGKFILYGIAK